MGKLFTRHFFTYGLAVIGALQFNDTIAYLQLFYQFKTYIDFVRCCAWRCGRRIRFVRGRSERRQCQRYMYFLIISIDVKHEWNNIYSPVWFVFVSVRRFCVFRVHTVTATSDAHGWNNVICSCAMSLLFVRRAHTELWVQLFSGIFAFFSLIEWHNYAMRQRTDRARHFIRAPQNYSTINVVFDSTGIKIPIS